MNEEIEEMMFTVPQKIVAYDGKHAVQHLYREQRQEIAEAIYNAGYRKVGSDAKGNLLKIQNLCIEFDEMGYEPTTLCENPEQTAKKWKSDLMYEIGLFLDEAMGIKARYNELKAENERLKDENAKLQEQFAKYQLASGKEILAQVKQAKIDVLNELKKRNCGGGKMGRIKIEKRDDYYAAELLDVFPDEVCILGGGYTKEEAIAEMKANAEVWLGYEIDEAKVEKYWNGELVEVQDGEN